LENIVATVEQVQMKVQKFLQKNGNIEITEQGAISIPWGSSHIFIDVEALTETITVVRIAGVTVLDIPVTDELCRDLIINKGMKFGSWGIERESDSDKTGNLVFSHHILGNDLDEDELMVSLGLVGAATDNNDDELVARFGGKRVEDIRE
jgi:hypothetical protein